MLFQRRRFFIRERVSMLKLCDTYDILDPETKQNVAIAKDEPPMWAKLMRLLVKKPLLPTTIHVYETESAPPTLTLQKKPGFLHQTVIVSLASGQAIARFKSKLFALGGGFNIFDPSGKRKLGEVKGDWKGWNFKMLDPNGKPVGVVTKKWAGIGKELFTTADNYIVALDDQNANTANEGPMMLAAGLAVDIVYKEAA